MVRDDFRGDFTGFEFGGIHSAELGIVRVSGGDRYEENLHPEIKDITAEVPGMDGQYYFGSNYGTKTFDIEFAFDSLTETEFRKLRQTFGTRKIQKLVFDECPYKYYLAKIENPIELSYVCFYEPKRIIDAERDGVRVTNRITATGKAGEAVVGYSRIDVSDLTVIGVIREKVTPFKHVEGQRERIYKGEGKISFVCYFPFAKSAFKVLSAADNYKNVDDWAFSSGLLSEEEYAGFDNYTSGDETITITPNEGFTLEESVFKQAVGDYGVYVFTCYDNAGTIAWQLNDHDINSLDTYGATCLDAKPGDVFTVVYSQLGVINIYNAGDIPTGFRLYCSFAASLSMKLNYQSYLGTEGIILNITEITPKEGDIGFIINTTNGLIQGVQSFSGSDRYTLSGNLYNEYVDSGYFFQLQPNQISSDGAKIIITDWENNFIESGYVLSEDIEVKSYKLYYTRTSIPGEEVYKYDIVNNPIGNPHSLGYYENKNITIFYDYLYF